MKVYALTLLFLSVNFSHGKNNDTLNTSFQNEIYSSYGMFSFSSIFIGYRITDNDLSFDYLTNKSNYTKKLTEIPPLLGTLNFGYKRYIKNKFGIIMNITFSQIDALGIRIGKKIGAFVEAGFGFNGIIKVGLSGQF